MDNKIQIFEENREIAIRGGKYAGNARKEIEADTGNPVVNTITIYKDCRREKWKQE